MVYLSELYNGVIPLRLESKRHSWREKKLKCRRLNTLVCSKVSVINTGDFEVIKSQNYIQRVTVENESFLKVEPVKGSNLIR